jgi:hypothetical protein
MQGHPAEGQQRHPAAFHLAQALRPEPVGRLQHPVQKTVIFLLTAEITAVPRYPANPSFAMISPITMNRIMGEAQTQEISEVGGDFDPGHKWVFEGLPVR